MKIGKYRHFKGNEYEVLGVSKNSETLDEYVIYRALYGKEQQVFELPNVDGIQILGIAKNSETLKESVIYRIEQVQIMPIKPLSAHVVPEYDLNIATDYSQLWSMSIELFSKKYNLKLTTSNTDEQIYHQLWERPIDLFLSKAKMADKLVGRFTFIE